MYERLPAQLAEVQDRIAAAQQRAGRTGDVRVVAVTKGHTAVAVDAAVRAGLRDVGENRVQELEEKRGVVGAAAQPVWHLIGHLQRNKVRRAIQLFDTIHSIDSLRLAEELSKEAVRSGITVRGLVQVNVSGEASKGGFDAAAAVELIAAVTALPSLAIEGLMTMAPLTADARAVRATFAGTRALLEQCVSARVPLQARELSMGMSGDYEVAIEEGSTMVRLGTVLFGERLV